MGKNVVQGDRELLRDVMQQYRSKMSPSLAKLAKESDAVMKQFAPSHLEAEPFGTTKPFEEGKNNHGIYGLERIYEDRAVITPYFECAAYCRYCFKKSRTLAGEAKRMSDSDINRAVEFIRQDTRIKTALITGGDPFLDVELLQKVLDQVSQIDHIRNIRVGTRNILFSPETVSDELADLLASYQQIDYQNPRNSRNISVGLSINHVDELTPAVVGAYQKLLKRGVAVRGQTVLLKGINDSVGAIQELMEAFLCTGIVPYYFLHCMPVVGAKHFRTTVQKGIDIIRELSARSGSYAPHYVYVTPAGKHRLGPDAKLTYQMIDGKRYIRAVTPYRAEDFLAFSDNDTLPELHETDEDGYIVSRYLDGEED